MYSEILTHYNAGVMHNTSTMAPFAKYGSELDKKKKPLLFRTTMSVLGNIACELFRGLCKGSKTFATQLGTALKDSYSFETRMCGTIKCRPTLAYRIHFDSINISAWTDYKILLQREIGKMLF